MGVVCWHMVSPPNDSGYPPPPLPCNFFGEVQMIVVVDRSADRILGNFELAVLVAAVFSAIAIVLIPF